MVQKSSPVCVCPGHCWPVPGWPWPDVWGGTAGWDGDEEGWWWSSQGPCLPLCHGYQLQHRLEEELNYEEDQHTITYKLNYYYVHTLRFDSLMLKCLVLFVLSLLTVIEQWGQCMFLHIGTVYIWNWITMSSVQRKISWSISSMPQWAHTLFDTFSQH